MQRTSHIQRIGPHARTVQKTGTKRERVRLCVCLEECCRPSFLCVFHCVFRQALSPAGFVTEWVQYNNTIENISAVVNRSSGRAGQNTAQQDVVISREEKTALHRWNRSFSVTSQSGINTSLIQSLAQQKAVIAFICLLFQQRQIKYLIFMLRNIISIRDPVFRGLFLLCILKGERQKCCRSGWRSFYGPVDTVFPNLVISQRNLMSLTLF